MIDPGRIVGLSVDSKIYQVYAGNRALRLIERETGLSMLAVVGKLEEGSITLITTLTWALLQQHHPGLTLEDVDEILDVAGHEAVVDAIGRAIELAFPEAVNQPLEGKARQLPLNGSGTAYVKA